MDILYTLIGGGVLLATIIFGAMKYGQQKEKNKIAEANQEASKKATQVAEAIINRKSGDGIANLNKLSKTKR